jgi:hypothetical protein
MAQILPFLDAERRPRPERSVSVRAAMAEIVIFPGVRVEYHDEPPEPAGDGRSRGGRRRQAKAALSA